MNYPNTKFLFIGDSITDCGWKNDHEEIGDGYVRIIRDYLLAKDPADAPTVINRGISGNKIPDLQRRWKCDALDLNPDLISIYIGINDVWHSLRDDREGCDIDTYRVGYQDILSQIPSGVKIILCEPSVLWIDEKGEADKMLEPYIAAVHELAGKFHAAGVVPLHATFNNARNARPEIPWTSDGVHPTDIGHMLIAQTWLKTAGML
jgi:acyl-CoA thioesterase-1